MVATTWGGGTSGTAAGGNWVGNTTFSVTSSTNTVISNSGSTSTWVNPGSSWTFKDYLQNRTAIDIQLGWEGAINLPDGSILRIDDDGNYQIDDSDAKVIYKACRRLEFNRYLNASDLLEEFILDAGRLGVKQHQVVEGLFGAFLHWMILKAAEADGDPVPDGILPLKKHPALLERPKPKPNHCRVCGRFIKDRMVRAELPFCNDTHILIHMQKKGCL